MRLFVHVCVCMCVYLSVRDVAQFTNNNKMQSLI